MLVLFIAVAFAKCRLWDTYVENSVIVTRSKETCYDWEQFYQCQRAQQHLDRWITNTLIKPIDAGCHNHLLCIGWFPTLSGTYYCSQFDAYRLCLAIQRKVTNIPVICNSDETTDGISPTLFYAFERGVNNTLPALTLPPGLSAASCLGISFILLILIL